MLDAEHAAVLAASATVALASTVVFRHEITTADVPVPRRLAGAAIRLLHDFIVTFFILMLLLAAWRTARGAMDLATLLGLNALSFAIIAQFFAFKRCALTIAYERVLRLPACQPYVSFFAAATRPTRQGLLDCDVNTNDWIVTNTLQVIALSVLNAVFWARLR